MNQTADMPEAQPESAGVPRPGRLIVISGPSGVGKDTVIETVLARTRDVVKSVSSTTRGPRAGEAEGVDYHFTGRAEFERDIARGKFYEHAAYNGNLYGTPREWVNLQRSRGLDVILKIEVQGAHIVREMSPDAVLVFVMPPSMEELERRLRSRRSESDDRVTGRLEIARHEVSRSLEYDYLVVNDELEHAVDTVRSIILAERVRQHKHVR